MDAFLELMGGSLFSLSLNKRDGSFNLHLMLCSPALVAILLWTSPSKGKAWLLEQAIERNGTQISYGKLLESMYYSIASLHGGPPPSYSGFLGRMMDSAMDFAGGGGQTPCLCANTAFDFNRPLAI